MRLEDMLKDISGITNKVVKTNCFEGQNTLLDSILLIQTKVNEVIQAINDGIIKGDKGDTPNVQVGVTETLEPNSNASVTQTGDMLNPIFNFGIPKGEKGEKGDTGKASESIQDNLTSLDTTWSSTKIDSLFKNIDDTQGLEYITENNFYSINGSKNGVITNIKLEGKTLVVDSNNNVVIPGTEGATLKSVGDGVNGITLNSININLLDLQNVTVGYCDNDGNNFTVNNNSVVFTNDNLVINGTCPQYKRPCIRTRFNYPKGVYVFSYDDRSNISSESQWIFGIDKENNLVRFDRPSTGVGGKEIVFTVDKDLEYLLITHNTTLYGVGNLFFFKPKLNINSKKNYIKPKKNTKNVLYKDTDGTWKKPTLRQWDSIEKHSDGKYYYHKRSDVYNINGSENWTLTKTNNNTIVFYTDAIRYTSVGSDDKLNNIVCDRFKEKTVSNVLNDDLEGINNSNLNIVRISINKNKLQTQDLQGFKLWLQNNNVKLVYKLSQEQVFECTPIDLISYDTQTNYSIECGHIYPKSTLYINSDYGNVLSNIIRRITQIEEDRIEDRKALIRGDFRLLAEKSYPNDFIKEEELPNE